MRVLCTCAVCVCMQIHLYCIRNQLPMHLEPVLSHVECTCTCYLRHRAGVHMAVFFAEYRLFYRALLQKRPIILSILLTEATPYRASVLVCTTQDALCTRTLHPRYTHPTPTITSALNIQPPGPYTYNNKCPIHTTTRSICT